MKKSVSTPRRLLRSFWLAAPLVLAGHATAHADPSAPALSRGHYLAIAADCAACHTNGHDGAKLAGGYPIASPLGVIYSTNITPSKTYGIGTYTLDQFSRAIRHGVRADGAQLYPAMPYGSYSRLTDEDVAALYDYLMHEVEPVDRPAPKTNLPFPFSIRASLWGWKLLSGVEGTPYVADPAHDAAWNRGKYLVDTLAHCGECHTPRNMLMAPSASAYLAGGDLGSWRAPNITSDATAGIGGWSAQDLQDYLRTGRSTHARAAGPMAEAVEHSFQYLTPADLAAMAAYLKTVPAIAEPGQTAANFSHGGKAAPFDYAAANARRNSSTLKGITQGNVLYENVCASCHQTDGRGSADGYYPSLVGNTTTGQRNPDDLVASILFGVDRTVDGHQILMPGFGPDSLVQPLDDQQVATLANYVLGHFGNAQAAVTAESVATIRAGGPKPAIAQLSEPRVLAVLAIAGLVILGVLALALRFVLKSRRAA
ncbi:cytochrome c [Gluconacetobacter sacchari]|uniref:Cytochrome c n=2 Tax=Gluconacetobacter sacchari TaxID=92759 RepID=A0A7W4NP07_9PROT|nr:cytochrome c [Gluconacetobacter sacchari]MBB2161324.1 cytochrome c [Gluconacetobacter sacchari]GBQ30588.1 sorbitol dehydrogenase cytochrome c subunit [Gluconacetobacter sacchari DSM 12717]